MKVYDQPGGRLGNAIFRYLASSLFCILYNGERTNSNEDCDQIITDESFIYWFTIILNNQECYPSFDHCYKFNGYFQHDEIYKKYKKELVTWIQTHPNDILKTDGDIPFFKSIDILSNSESVKMYDTVVHIRLEDFIQNNDVIHPLSLKNILDQLSTTSFCFVCNKISHTIEQQYIHFFKKYYDITVESNDVLADYTIMKNAKTLVCSLSTLSWCAAFFANNPQTVYFPDYTFYRNHETFKTPSDNTIHYPFIKCTADDLQLFLNDNL